MISILKFPNSKENSNSLNRKDEKEAAFGIVCVCVSFEREGKKDKEIEREKWRGR